MQGRIFPSWIQRTVNSTDAYLGKTFGALLLKASYNSGSGIDTTDIFVSDLTPASNEVGGAGVTYSRVTSLTGLTISKSGSVTTVTWNPIVFSLVTATGANAARSMVIYMNTGTDSTSTLVLQQDFEVASDATSEDITVTAAAGSGFIQYTSTP